MLSELISHHSSSLSDLHDACDAAIRHLAAVAAQEDELAARLQERQAAGVGQKPTPSR